MLSIDAQIYVFLLIFLLGVIVGLLFDLVRAGRLLLTRTEKRLYQDIFDLVFLAVSAIVVVMGIVLLNWGELRLYVFLALLGGFLGYTWLASPFVFGLIVMFSNGLKKVMGFLWRIISYPLSPLKSFTLRFFSKNKGLGIRVIKVCGYFINRVSSLWKKLPGFL